MKSAVSILNLNVLYRLDGKMSTDNKGRVTDKQLLGEYVGKFVFLYYH